VVISIEVDVYLRQEAQLELGMMKNTFVCLVIDEVKIKEKLM